MATFHYADLEVYSGGITPPPWQTIDLTLQSDGITPTGMPADRCLAVLKITPWNGDGVSPFYVFTRPSGDATDWCDFVNPTCSQGTTGGCFIQSAIHQGFLVVSTDAAGAIDIASDVIFVTRINLYGWIDAEYSGALVYNDHPTLAFADLDLSAVVGNARSLIFDKVNVTEEPIFYTVRTKERPEEVTGSAALDVVYGVENMVVRNVDYTCGIATVTDEHGIIEHRQEVGVPGHIAVNVLMHVEEHEGYVHVNKLIPDVAPATAAHVWNTIDLSWYLSGQKRTLCFLKARRIGGAAAPVTIAFKPADLAANIHFNEDAATAAPYGTQCAIVNDGECGRYLVPTDALGRIAWRVGGPGDGVVDPGSVGLWLIGYIDSGLMTVTRIWQTSLNTVDVEFSEAIRYLDPSDPRDTLYRAAYTVTGPASPARVLQSVTIVDDTTIRLWFDGDLVVGESYTISITGLVSVAGFGLTPDPTTGTFIAYGPDRHPVPLIQQTSGRFDVRNPQATRDAPEGSALGTFVVDADGDIGIETGRPYLRKRIFRRLATRKGEMFHEPNYGLSLKDKGLYRPAELRALQMDVEAQVRAEPNVKACRASVSEYAPGVVYVALKVQDDLGWFDLETELRGPYGS